MTPTKLLIGQIIVVFVIVLAGVWFATQWAAAELAYQPELGRPWFIAFGRPIYQPWALFGWWFSFEAYAPVLFEKAGGIAAASGLSCLPVQGVSATNSFLPQSDRNQSTGSAPGQSRRHDFKTTVDHALIRGLVTAGPDASRSCLCLENQRRIETRLLVVTRVLLP